MAVERPARATAVVVMGVAGVGKTTVASALSEALGWPLAEADAFHSPANIAKMSAGTPLTDADREPWLAAMRDWIDEHGSRGEPVVVTCSALKRSYRDVLRQAGARVTFVHLVGTAEVIGERMTHRAGHFMPAELLRSQLDDLQPLEGDEDGVVVDTGKTPAEIVQFVLARLHPCEGLEL